MALSESSAAEHGGLDHRLVITTDTAANDANERVVNDNINGTKKPNTVVIPNEVILETLSFCIEKDLSFASWSERFGAVQVLEYARPTPETVGFPNLQNDCAVKYLSKKLFAVVFDLPAGHTMREILANLEDNDFLKEHLNGPDESMRVRRLLLVIRPGPSHLSGFDGETGVVYEITFNLAAMKRTVRRVHEYKVDFMLAWPPRAALHKAIDEYIKAIPCAHDRSPFVGLNYRDIVGLCRLVDSYIRPSFYTLNDAQSMLSRQSAYRKLRREKLAPREEYDTDEEEYDSPQW
ncbi:hypothetical protein AMS68_004263 [Peltaster fructicola]|uniref:Uncharacterized protein n=1 Tax=Peltaster fructicola TaxID=286661 RepID=A0A6H0XVN1_9PEZI|nr:hypothetical protein AMS68_004263 [Peltaster fructicola]